MGTATLDNAEVELLWAMTKAVELLRKILQKGGMLSDGKLMETQTANYFSDIYPIDCAVLSANA